MPVTTRAKNVILLVADGNGVATNYATRIYQGQQAGGYGDENVMSKESLPYLALSKTYNTIASQLLDKMRSGEVDFAIGGGRGHFLAEDVEDEEGSTGKRLDGRNLIDEATAAGAQYAWNDATFDALALDGSAPVLGLFESSHMLYEHDRTVDLGEVDDAGEVHLGSPSIANDGKTYTAIGYLNGAGSVVTEQPNGSVRAQRRGMSQADATNPDYLQQALIPLDSETHSPVDVAIYSSGPLGASGGWNRRAELHLPCHAARGHRGVGFLANTGACHLFSPWAS